MPLPSREEARQLLELHVRDDYQRYHARMVATALEGYAGTFRSDPDLWFLTGLLHDLDFEQHPDTHPRESLRWFTNWAYPGELIHAVEAQAFGYNGYATRPCSPLAAALLATDELCGIFNAYRKLNPVRYGEMKPGSIKKKLKDTAFAAKVDRATITTVCEALGLSEEDHVANMIRFLAAFD